MRFTRIVRTGLSMTVSTPAIAAAWTTCVAPSTVRRRRSPSRTSPSTNSKLGCAASSVPVSESRCRLSSATGSQTTLTVTYWPDGAQKAEKTVWTLDCRTGTGALKRPGVACAHLAAGGWKLFAPVRKDEVCTEIYGGPQMALVVGTVEGRRV